MSSPNSAAATRTATGRRLAHPAASPAAARSRIASLRAAGGTYRSIAEAAGLAPMTVHDLAAGRAQTRPGTLTALLGVTSDAVNCLRIDAGGTRLRLRALHVMGHGSARIARAIGANPAVIRSLVRGETVTVSVRLSNQVTSVYEAWWDKRAPGRTPAERSAAARARSRAVRSDWCAAAALDDDLLDVPGYQPDQGWHPAHGTGIATQADVVEAAREPPCRRPGRLA